MRNPLAQIEIGQSRLDELAAMAQTENEWPEPQPIPDTLLPVEQFAPELLPEALRPWVSDIADRLQCPPDFPAVGAMVALSSVIGRKVVLRPKRYDDWAVVPNLWGALVGRPGVMKSPALMAATAPLERLGALASDLHKEAVAAFKIDSQLADLNDKTASRSSQS